MLKKRKMVTFNMLPPLFQSSRSTFHRHYWAPLWSKLPSGATTWKLFCVLLLLITLLLVCFDTFLLTCQESLYIISNGSVKTSAFRLAPLNRNAGLGNMLSIYWYGRALAYWQGLGFELKHSIWLQWFPKVSGNFLQYLPNYTPFLLHHTQPTHIGDDSQYLYYKQQLELLNIDLYGKDYTRYSHTISQLMAFYNGHFMFFVRNDTHAAMQQYFQSHTESYAVYREKLHNNDIVIHLRCGDILHSGHELYHFMTFKYYTYILDHIIAQRKNFNNNIINNINNKNSSSNDNNNRQQSVYLLSQISKAGSHLSKEAHSMKNCAKLAESLRSALNERYPDMIFEVMNNDIVNDFAMMLYAPYLICGTSSFCLHAAVANQFEHVYLPDVGPWDFLSKHQKAMQQNGILPKTHVVVEAQKNGWSVKSSEVVHKGWNQGEKFDEFINFLLTN